MERESALPELRAAVEGRRAEQQAHEAKLDEVQASLKGETAQLREQLEREQTALAA